MDNEAEPTTVADFADPGGLTADTGVIAVGHELPTSLIDEILSKLFSHEEMVQYRALFKLRQAVLANGQAAQAQVCSTAILPRVKVMITLETEGHYIQEAALRLVCTLSAKNPSTLPAVATPDVVAAVLAATVACARHEAAGCSVCDEAGEAMSAEAAAEKQVFSGNCCRRAAVGCGSLWALCAISMRNLPLQRDVVARSDCMQALLVLLSSRNEEVVCAAAWAVCNLLQGNASGQAAFASAGVVPRLITALASGPEGAKGLIAWTIRALVVDNKALQDNFVSSGVVPPVLALTRSPLPAAKAAAVWTLSTLCTNNPSVQEHLGTFDDGAAVKRVVELLDDPATQVTNQCSTCVYNMAARNRDVQTLVGNIGGIEKLVKLLPTTQGSIKQTEKALAAILCLALRHDANQQRIARVQGFPFQIVRLVSCTAPRIQGLAAGVIRTLVAEQPSLQLLFAAHGAFPNLLDLAGASDFFAQEQAAAALYNIIAQQPANKPYLASLNPQDRMVAIISDCRKPTRLAYTCACMVLYSLCLEESLGFKATLQAEPVAAKLLPGLLRLSHPAVSDARLRSQADRLLLALWPELTDNREQRKSQSATALLEALVPIALRLPVDAAAASAAAAAPTGGDGGSGGGASSSSVADGEQRVPPVSNVACALCGAHGGSFVFYPCLHAYHIDCARTLVKKDFEVCPRCSSATLSFVPCMLGSDSGESLPSSTAPV